MTLLSSEALEWTVSFYAREKDHSGSVGFYLSLKANFNQKKNPEQKVIRIRRVHATSLE